MNLPGFADLLWLADHAADITDARFKGTRRPWRQAAQLNPEAAAEQLERDLRERRERNPLAIGEHPAPLHVDVLDLLVDLLATADTLAQEIAQAAGVERLPDAASAFDDPEPYLRHAAQHLRAATEDNRQLGQYVAEEAARLKGLVARHLGEVLDGQTVPGLCPWCQGGISGQQTLRIRLVRPAPTLPAVPAAVCESGLCEPPEADVGIWHRDRPAWPLDTEGEWLSKRIAHKAADGPLCQAPASMDLDEEEVCGKPLLPTGRPGRPAQRYCSATCRRTADAVRRRDERQAG